MKKITIYENLEQQKKLEIEASLKLTPAERIAQAVAMIKKIYPNGESKRPKRITFQEHWMNKRGSC